MGLSQSTEVDTAFADVVQCNFKIATFIVLCVLAANVI